MSLNFKYLGKEDTKLWSKDDWTTYNVLIWATMATDINYLCEESADEFVRRLNSTRIYNEEIKKEDIVKFYGLSTNADLLTSHQWALKHFADRNKCGHQWVKEIVKANAKVDKDICL